MKKIMALLIACVALTILPGMVFATTIIAGGSTFIYPVLSQWTKAYNQSTGVQVNYQPIGSGGGIKELANSTLVFAASDMPLDPQQLNKNNWMQFPMIVGGIVPVVNLPGVKNNQLVLNGKVLANIYLGKIKYWDNNQIKALNPKLALSHQLIIPVHRADGSGTTYNFTNYLSKVSSTWAKQVGFNTEVSWPGMGLGAKGNAGVAAQVSNVPGAIGYVEYAYALQNNMVSAKLINSDNKTVTANSASFAAAAKNAKWSTVKNFKLVLTNQPGANSWPIVATTFILLPKQTDTNTKQAVKFFTWCYNKGGQMAAKLDYVPMPASVISLIQKQWQANKL